MKIEGILFQNNVGLYKLHNAQFIRCNFVRVGGTGSIDVQNVQYINCIANQFYVGDSYDIVMINSVAWNASGLGGGNPLVIYNSIMDVGSSSGFNGLVAYNSILIRKYANNGPGSACSFFNCIGINVTTSTYTAFGSGYTLDCIAFNSYEDVFESFDGDFSFDESFILKDNVATGFIGSDGTQVGIHGGSVPYSNIPSYMLRTQVSVPNRSNIDGTLNVEIEVIDDNE